MPSLLLNARPSGSRIIRADPTRTALIRRQFQAEILRRIRELKSAVFEFLVTLDALGLQDVGTVSGRLHLSLGLPIALAANATQIRSLIGNTGPREFQFRTSAGKVQAFRDWLEEQIKAKILAPRGPGSRSGMPWTAKYMESAYKKGKLNAYISSQKADFLTETKALKAKLQETFLKKSFNAPELTSKIELLATRSFEELRGVTSAMAQQMNRILAGGIADGSNPRSIAAEMSAAIDTLTDRRALLIARTEVINAHAEGQLDSFQELGVEDLGVDVEWSTAGDDRVCPECEALNGQTYSIDEARGLIPLHPNCRCSWVPAVT